MTSEFTFPATALVTGGAKRIGASLVRALASDGWHVAIHCNRSTREAEELRAGITSTGGSASIFCADLADPAEATRLIEQVQGSCPPLRFLVNNASIYEYDRLDSFTAEGFARHLDINLKAPAILIQSFARTVGQSNGLVVNLLDSKLKSLNPDFFTYTISKAALATLTELAARALAPHVRVCGIAPSITLVSGPQSRRNFEQAHVYNPLRRGVTADQIVEALRFIVRTPTIHAEVITLDSGHWLMGLERDVSFVIDEST